MMMFAPRNVALTSELEELIRRKLESGMYENAAEVVREGLRLLAEEDEWKAGVRRKISEGMAQARAGKLVDGEAAADRLMKRIQAQRKKAK
jgi:antitoxin ParD1/3/4